MVFAIPLPALLSNVGTDNSTFSGELTNQSKKHTEIGNKSAPLRRDPSAIKLKHAMKSKTPHTF
jgi:hypothetical protein